MDTCSLLIGQKMPCCGTYLVSQNVRTGHFCPGLLLKKYNVSVMIEDCVCSGEKNSAQTHIRWDFIGTTEFTKRLKLVITIFKRILQSVRSSEYLLTNG